MPRSNFRAALRTSVCFGAAAWLLVGCSLLTAPREVPTPVVVEAKGPDPKAPRLAAVETRHLELAKGQMSLVVLLRAIANSGYAAALPRVLPYLDDKRERIRAVALRSLQSMPDARVDSIIATRLGRDESSKVRLSAIEAAKLREPGTELVAALSDVSTGAEDNHVRFRAVELMASWLP